MERIAELLILMMPEATDGTRMALLALASAILTAVIVVTLMRRRTRHAASESAAMMAQPAMSRGTWGARMQRRAAVSTEGDGPSTTVGGAGDPEWRIQAVAAHNYRTRSIFSRSQARVLPMLERIVYTRGHGHRLLAHASLGHLLEPVATPSATADRLTRAARALDGLTVGFPILDADGQMIAAIELKAPRSLHPAQDEGDAVKRAVLRRAGVPLIEITPADDEARLLALIVPLLSGARPAAANG